MGRDINLGVGILKQEVSTHAPAWGATPYVGLDVGSIMFQPTRPHGARLTFKIISYGLASFNPRARMGRDARAEQNLKRYRVSTHAPAWGAT